MPRSSVATVTRGFVVFRFEELEVERQSREMATSLSFSFFFFYYYQGNVPVWRGMKVPRVRFLDEKVANASLPSIDLRFFFFPVGMGIAPIQNYFWLKCEVVIIPLNGLKRDNGQ